MAITHSVNDYTVDINQASQKKPLLQLSNIPNYLLVFLMSQNQWLFFFCITCVLIFAPIHNASAHCDTLNGPVVTTAQTALQTGNVTPVLKWVRVEDEAQIRNAFEKTLKVRVESPEAQELADMYFFETLVRIHRASEGAPYTGLQPSHSTSPIIQLADEAIESGSADKLVEALSNKLSNNLEESFTRTLKTHKVADESVDNGREFVNQYVTFTHFVEDIHSILDHTQKENGHSEH